MYIEKEHCEATAVLILYQSDSASVSSDYRDRGADEPARAFKLQVGFETSV